ncbi:glycoside hydrolase family 31 protein [Lactobacillus sp. ESL0679]|uniref:TIM-barrel domain-containing protein n=1 Tax=Lactobacillus sp. ESL0679 TaxID=2983209 RepID=UPI0023F8BB3F|nr:TIM-barrel domain-containing protein [Lactobacillus sp. ESL0679]MDF7682327.1 glycoside hydrolase family 31 protein [Lactobacillus sp. ESL0679]
MTDDMQTGKHQLGALTGANRCENYYELHYATGEVAQFYVLADGIFRFVLNPNTDSAAEQTSALQLNFSNESFEHSQVRATSDSLIIQAGNYQVIFAQKPAVMSIFDETLHRTRMKQAQPLELAANQTREFLKQNKNEFYFGGGLQNGYFSHKGRKIAIKSDHITGKGGVITQVPFFWSNAGYGELRNTYSSGSYDFGVNNSGLTTISHQDRIFDNFYIIGDTPQAILAKYYALTGKPMMLPKYTLGLGHVGNFCTTLWQPSETKERNASKFGNNYYTRTSDTDKAAGRASLNGEEDYHFSARAMLDRYKTLHFPLSWFVPNYGVTNPPVDALNYFNEYAQNQDVTPGFWHDDSLSELPEQAAFTLTANHATNDRTLLSNALQRKKPLVLQNTGCQGMQKTAALAFGAIGGNWENIATQVAGFIGSNLSGQPLVGAAVDGTTGGGNAQISVRDFEWKSFTPLLFSLDDQGNFSKTPFAYNKRVTEINRSYSILRAQLQSYLYTLNHQAQAGNPIVQPLFIAFPDERSNYTEQFSSEFMLGSNLLIAPITNGREDENGDSRKDNLYLPDSRTMWLDLFTGKKYAGGRVYNNLSYPVWHLPVFVRGGSVFDLGKRDYVLYPQGQSRTIVYDDDDLTDFNHNYCETSIDTNQNAGNLAITINPVKGNYPGFDVEQSTNLAIMCDAYPDQIEVKINDQIIKLQEYGTIDAFNHAREGIFFNTNYNPVPEFNQYHDAKQTTLQIKLANRDVTNSKIKITIHNYTYGENVLVHAITDGLLPSPKLPAVDPSKISAHSFELAWSKQGAVQIEINGLLYEGITGNCFTFHELLPNTRYIIRMRYAAGNKVSEWSDPFGVITKHAAIDYAVSDIHVISNYPSNPAQPLSYLTDLKLASEWQIAQALTPEKPLELTFTFNQIEKLSRMAFVPHNIDHCCDPIDISVAVSTDGFNYVTYADHLKWKADSKNKVIGLRDVRAKAIRLIIYQASGPLVASREVIFFRAKK